MNGVLHGNVRCKTIAWINSPGAADGHAAVGRFSIPPTDGARASALGLLSRAALRLEMPVGP